MYSRACFDIISLVKKRYFYLLHPVYHILTAAIDIILLAAFIVNILRLTQAGEFVSYNYPLDITAAVVMPVLAALLSSFVWGSGYTLGRDGLYINIGIYIRKIPYDNILKLRSDEVRSALAIYYGTNIKAALPEEQEAVVKGEMIRIKKDLYDKFAKEVTRRSPRAEYEIVTKEEE